MSTLQSPSYIQPATVSFSPSVGPQSLGIPWVDSFDEVPSGDLICVLIQPLRSSVAGLWALVQTFEDKGQSHKWKLALGFRETCNVIATSATLQIFFGVQSSQSYPPGYSVWKNGQAQPTPDVFPETGAIWVVTHVPSSGGGGGGGDVDLTATHMPIDMPTPVSTDPQVSLDQDGISVSHLNLKTLTSIGGVNLGAVVVGVNR